MASSILALSELPRADVIAYLRGHGLSEELAQWKFFDASINPQDHERGLGWVKDGRLQGFLGLIPATLGRDGSEIGLTWTCDWSLAERVTAPGIGVRMLRQAMDAHDHLMYLTRGSEYTEQIAPRVAQRTIEDSVVLLAVPLRLGALLHGLRHRTRWMSPEAWPRLAGLPLRHVADRSDSVVVERGVSRSIASLLDEPRGPGWYPRYDWTYVDWAVGRCPVLVSHTVRAPHAGAPDAAALLWSRRESPHMWRMTLWARTGATDALRDVVWGALQTARDAGGWMVSVLVSRLDEPLIAAVREWRGVVERPRQPLFLFTSLNPEVDEVGNLSFLDADLAYQF